MEPAKNAEIFTETVTCLPQSWPLGQVASEDALWHCAAMARKRLILLDPDNSFEVASRHLYRCKKCKNAGMEWAQRKDLCPRGRQLLQDLDRVERIYEAVERAA